MEKLCGLLFGVSVLWFSGTLCFPAEVLKNLPSHNRTLRETQCNEDEYSFQEICCQKCPAGTYVADHCTEDHRRGSCQPCSAGQDYLASPSDFEECLTCLVCRSDQVKVRECTTTSDTVCQCNPGTYCIPGDVCEICNKCLRCGKGKRVKEECTITKNTVCEDIPITQPTSNTTSSYLIPKDLTKIISSPPTTGVTKPINSTPEKDVPKDPDPKNEDDVPKDPDPKNEDDVPKDPDPKNEDENQSTNYYLVAFVILAVITIPIIAFGAWYLCREREKQNTNQNLLANSTNPSAISSVQSTPIADRANQGLPQPPLESVPLLASSNALDNSIMVLEPTEPSSTQGPQSTEDPGPGGDDRGGGGGGATLDNEPCTHCGLLPPCNCDWTSYIHCIFDHVRTDYIVRLVRDLRVPNNIIDCIIKDNPNNTYEQSYKLLERWRTLAGQQASMENIFGALRNMELGGSVENIINSLRSRNIPIL